MYQKFVSRDALGKSSLREDSNKMSFGDNIVDQVENRPVKSSLREDSWKNSLLDMIHTNCALETIYVIWAKKSI